MPKGPPPYHEHCHSLLKCGTMPDDQHLAEPPKAERRLIRPEFQRNGVTHVVYFSQATHHPSDVFAYGREALHCFMDRRYLATITMANALVEIVLNKDSRMRTSTGMWCTLSLKLVRTAERHGLPVHQLLNQGEGLTGKSLAFIDLRNRIAHGNLAGLIGFEHEGTPDYSAHAREVALEHLEKAERFEVEWYNTSPDVQERRIIHHRWPS